MENVTEAGSAVIGALLAVPVMVRGIVSAPVVETCG